MSIRNWPERERPREKLMEHGAAALSDSELLAVVIGSGTRGSTAVEVGRSLIYQYGSLGEFFEQGVDHRSLPRGLGPAKFTKLAAAFELAQRCGAEMRVGGESLASPHQIQAYLKEQLISASAEHLGCLHLDTELRVLALETIYQGPEGVPEGIAKTVARQVMTHDSAFVAIAHWTQLRTFPLHYLHERINFDLRDAMAVLDVRILSHVVLRNRECLTLYAQDPATRRSGKWRSPSAG